MNASSMPLAVARHHLSSGPNLPVRLLPRPEWLSPATFPFDIKAVDLGDGTLTYVDEGDGPVLLFAPGSPMWSFMYRHAILSLREHFRCVSVDLPGLGLSSIPLRRGHAFASNADWMQAFVRAMPLPRFTLIAHATAGPPALEMAVRERDRIEGLVVTNSFAWPFSDVPQFRTFARVLSSAPIAFANIYLNLLPRIAASFGRRTLPFRVEESLAVAGPFRTRETRRHLQNLLLGLRVESAFLADLQRRVEALRDVPSLILYGGRDNGYRLGFVARWKSLLPRHEVVILDRADHFAPEDEPEAYTAALAAWWHRSVGRAI